MRDVVRMGKAVRFAIDHQLDMALRPALEASQQKLRRWICAEVAVAGQHSMHPEQDQAQAPLLTPAAGDGGGDFAD